MAVVARAAPRRGWTLLFYAACAMRSLGPAPARPARAHGAAASPCIVVRRRRLARETPAGWLRFTMIDVGQGEPCSFSFLPATRCSSTRAASRDVRRRRARRRARVWALGSGGSTGWHHAPDLDHVGGVPSVTASRRAKSGRVYPCRRNAGSGAPCRRARARAAPLAAGSGRRRARDRRRRVSRCTRHCPTGNGSARATTTRSCCGCVRRRRAAAHGDIGDRSSSVPASAERIGALRVLKVAHHGSRTSTSAAFVARTPATRAGQRRPRQPFGHPAPEVIGG